MNPNFSLGVGEGGSGSGAGVSECFYYESKFKINKNFEGVGGGG